MTTYGDDWPNNIQDYDQLPGGPYDHIIEPYPTHKLPMGPIKLPPFHVLNQAEYKKVLIKIHDGKGRQWVIPGFIKNTDNVLDEIKATDGSNLILDVSIVEED